MFLLALLRVRAGMNRGGQRPSEKCIPLIFFMLPGNFKCSKIFRSGTDDKNRLLFHTGFKKVSGSITSSVKYTKILAGSSIQFTIHLPAEVVFVLFFKDKNIRIFMIAGPGNWLFHGQVFQRTINKMFLIFPR